MMRGAHSWLALVGRLVPPQRGLLLAMLAVLYYALLAGPASLMGKAAFVAHLGFFMLWQPFVHTDQRLSQRAMILVPVAVVLAAAFINSWALVVWLMILAGIVGGKVSLLAGRGERMFYLLALGFLVLSLMLVAAPQASPLVQVPRDVLLLSEMALPTVLVLMVVMPRADEAERSDEVVDFINSLFVFLLLAVVMLSCLADMLMFGRGYVEALLRALFLTGGTLLLLSWAWNPHAGFAGLGDVFSRYLLSIGLPIEQVLQTLADLAAREGDPERFLDLACADIRQRLPWVVGGEWEADGRTGRFGDVAAHRGEFRHGDFCLTVHTRQSLSPVLLWHLNLLAQLLAEFYADKQRARDLKAVSYQQAIYETGARLTHDVKNLLQSLTTLCAALGEPGAEQSPEYQALLRRQLPAISARLAETLGKLRMPQASASIATVPAVRWWEELQLRLDGLDWVSGDNRAPPLCPVPRDVFAGAVDNILRNATEKRLREPALRVAIMLEATEGGAALTVSDDGSPVPAAQAGHLLERPVVSENGLGIGLYHSARFADAAGYRLTLAENRPGRVSFRLYPQA